MPDLEHPDISRALKWGYPHIPSPALLCADCGEELGDCYYETDSGLICRDCFCDRLQDMAIMEPDTLARALNIPRRYRI